MGIKKLDMYLVGIYGGGDACGVGKRFCFFVASGGVP